MEFQKDGQVFRRYFADQPEARAALSVLRLQGNSPAQDRMLAAITKHARPDGWADWTSVYNEWDPKNVPPAFAGQAAQKCWLNLERRGLVEAQADLVRRKAVN
jgi:hypothetical protein